MRNQSMDEFLPDVNTAHSSPSASLSFDCSIPGRRRSLSTQVIMILSLYFQLNASPVPVTLIASNNRLVGDAVPKPLTASDCESGCHRGSWQLPSTTASLLGARPCRATWAFYSARRARRIISFPLSPGPAAPPQACPALQFELRVPGSQPGAWVTRTGNGPVSDAVSDSESDYRDIGAHVGIRPGPP